MSKTLVLEIPDEVFSTYQEIAENKGETTEKIVLEIVLRNAPRLENIDVEQARLAEERFARWIGAGNSGNPRSGDNEQIDIDLAKEYGRDL